jgi:hypothetical protein
VQITVPQIKKFLAVFFSIEASLREFQKSSLRFRMLGTRIEIFDLSQTGQLHFRVTLQGCSIARETPQTRPTQ